jgi:hypothetical protein
MDLREIAEQLGYADASGAIGLSRRDYVTAILGWLLGIFTSVLIRHRTRRSR